MCKSDSQATKKKKDSAVKKRNLEGGVHGGSSLNPTKWARNHERENSSPPDPQGSLSLEPSTALPSQAASDPQKLPTQPKYFLPPVTSLSGSSTRSPSPVKDDEEIRSNNGDSHTHHAENGTKAPRTGLRLQKSVEESAKEDGDKEADEVVETKGEDTMDSEEVDAHCEKEGEKKIEKIMDDDDAEESPSTLEVMAEAAEKNCERNC